VVVTIADEDHGRESVRLAGEGAGGSVQRPSDMGEDDAIVEFSRLEHRVPERAARVDRVEDLLMAGGDLLLAGVQVAADRDEVGVRRECAPKAAPSAAFQASSRRLITVSAMLFGSKAVLPSLRVDTCQADTCIAYA
jgi:hypothetical protein